MKRKYLLSLLLFLGIILFIGCGNKKEDIILPSENDQTVLEINEGSILSSENNQTSLENNENIVLPSENGQQTLENNLEINDNKEDLFKLRITESSWSGWSRNYKPKEVTKDYDIVKGKEYIIKSPKGMENLIFTIEDIKTDSITIKTKYATFSESRNGTINLRSTQTIFTVYLDKKTKLVTKSRDAGDVYYLTLVTKKDISSSVVSTKK